MSNVVSFAQYAEPLEGDAPAGEELEYDQDYLKLDQMMEPPKAGMIEVDDEAALEDTVNWGEAFSLAKDLAVRTRDLRVAVRLTRCAVMAEGLEGLCAGIHLVRQLIENMWSDVHPQLDPDDDMDPMIRVNALGNLNSLELKRAIDNAPLAMTNTKMVATLKLIEISIGKRPSESEDERNMASGVVADAFMHESVDVVLSRKGAVDMAIEDLEAIDASWREHMTTMEAERAEQELPFEAQNPPQLDTIKNTLSALSRHLGEKLPSDDEAEGDADADGSGLASGKITSRADAERAIDQIADWFRRNEPSSPVPILLDRARQMISRSFLDIVDELGDGGIAEARKATTRGSGEG